MITTKLKSLLPLLWLTSTLLILSLVSLSCGKKQNNETNIEGDLGNFQNVTYKPGNTGLPSRYLVSAPFNIGALGTGAYRTAKVTLFLDTDKQFTLVYEENFLCKSSLMTPLRVFFEALVGTWNIQDGKLILKDVGEGDVIKNDNKDAIVLALQKDIHSTGLSGKTPLLTLVSPSGTMDQVLRDNATISEDKAQNILNTYCQAPAI